MRVYREIADLAAIPGPVSLAIGVFDGLHLGHQAVVGRAVAGSERDGGSSAVVTFDPHPATVLRPGKAPHLLVSTRHKVRLFERAGIRHFLAVRFDDVFAATPAREFVRQLAGACDPLGRVCVGEDWTFGRGREGNVQLLGELGSEFGFEIEPVSAVCVAGEAVSSTRIREMVKAGDLEAVRPLLGRDYTVLGTVVEGRHLGRTLGFPTANLRVHNEQLPPPGVYAVSVEVGGEVFGGVGNLGVRPTVEGEGGKKMLEVHLFAEVGDIYGHDLEVRFVKRIREEMKFAGLDALKEQIGLDVEEAKRALDASR